MGSPDQERDDLPDGQGSPAGGGVVKSYDVEGREGLKLPFEYLSRAQKARIAMAGGGVSGVPTPDEQDEELDRPDVPLWEGGPTVSQAAIYKMPAGRPFDPEFGKFPAQPAGNGGGPALFQMGQGQQEQLHDIAATTPIGPGQTAAVAAATRTPEAERTTPEPEKYQNPANLVFGDVADQAARPGVPQGQPTGASGMRMPGGGMAPDMKQLQAGVAAEKAGLLRGADIEALRSAQEHSILTSGLTAEEKAAQWQQLHAQDLGDFVQKQQKTTQDMLNDFRANSKVNPNAYWQNMSAGQKVGNSIALLLGGFNFSPNAKNQAQENITQGIKDNIDAQVMDIKTKRDAINDQQNMVAQYMKNGMDIGEAQHAALATQTQLVKDRMLANASGYAGQTAQAQAQVAAGKLDQDTAEHASNLRSASTQRAVALADLQMKKQEFGLQQASRQRLMDALRGGAIDTSDPVVAQHTARLPTGQTIMAPTPEVGKQGRDLIMASTAYDNAMADVEEKAKAAGTNPLSAQKDAYDQAVQRAVAAGHTFYKMKAGAGGAGGESEISGMPENTLQALAGKGGTNFLQKGHTLERIRQTREGTMQDLRGQLTALGFRMPRQIKGRKPGE